MRVAVTPFLHRRARRFAELLDAAPGTAPAPADDELATMAHTVAVLSATRAPAGAALDPAYADRLRTRLLAVAAVQEAPAPGDEAPRHRAPQHARRVRIPRRVLVAGPALAGVLVLSGVGAASSGAVPGDTLYPVKRTTESAQLTLASSDVNRGRLYLDFARTRLTETAAIADHGAALAHTLDDMDAGSRNGTRLLGQAAVEQQDRAPLDAIDSFVLAQRAQLIALIPKITSAERSRALDSLVLLERIQARSLELRGSLLCTAGYADAAASDELGPLPRRCAALPATAGTDLAGLPGPLTPPGIPGTSGTQSARAVPSGTPSLPGLGGTMPSGSVLPGPDLPNLPRPYVPGMPGYEEGGTGPAGLLGTVNGTVGDVVGGLLGPLTGIGEGDETTPSPSPTPSSSGSERLRDRIFGR